VKKATKKKREMTTAKMYKSLMLLLLSFTTTCMTSEIQWDHKVDLDDNFQLLWRVKRPDIIFEVQVRTHGYIGFGFARNEYIYGADMIVGWVDNEHIFFQVSKLHPLLISHLQTTINSVLLKN
jgi:hypothetical protein